MNIGTQVLRRSAPLDARVGTIERIATNHAYVRWPAPRRIGGEFHHSRLALKSLVVATQDEIDRRRAAIMADAEARKAHDAERHAAHLARCTHVCINHYETGKTWLVEPHQIRDGRCYSCGGEVRPRTEADL